MVKQEENRGMLVTYMRQASVYFCFCITLFLFLPLSLVFGQAPSTPPEEAPATLFEAQIGDAEVDLTAKVDWDISLIYGYGWGFSEDYDSPQATPFLDPDMETGFIFKKVPDVTLSLWLYNKYFFVG